MFAVKWPLGAVALVLILSACTKPPSPERPATFRNASQEIYSSAAFVPGKIAGSWQQMGAYSRGSDGPGCAPGRVSFTPSAGGLLASGQLCLNGQTRPVSGLVRANGPGRLQVPGMSDWWVIWVDADYRSLAIATPSGEFGFVLDRGVIGADRFNAAREIFDFNGYRKTDLRRF